MSLIRYINLLWFDKVKFILDNGENPNTVDLFGETALIKAILTNSIEMVQLLLDAGAIVNYKAYGNTPLCVASIKNNTEMVQLLLDAGADINYQDDLGKTPLMHAVYGENLEIVQLLLENDALVDILDQDGHTALYFSVFQDQVEMVRLLLDTGANVNIIERPNYSILANSIIFNPNVEIFKLLLEDGAYVEGPDESILQIAIAEDCMDLANLTIQHQVNRLRPITNYIKEHRVMTLFNPRSKVVFLDSTDPRYSECSEDNWVAFLKSTGYWDLLNITSVGDMYDKFDSYMNR